MTKRYSFFMKVLLSLMSVLMVCAFPLVGQIEYALQESFESGIIPTEWTQEYVSGSTDWIIEQGGIYPEGAADGSYRVVLRNETQQTQGFKTKLISPVMDLTKVYQPVLIFSHAQEHNLGDVDELRIYYRISEEAPWVLLKEYTERIRNWKTDTVPLVNNYSTTTYQFAFEGTDKYGRGIVLDDIMVRPIPICEKPVIQNAAEITSTSFTLLWSGSFDTDSFAIRISETRLSNVDEATNLVVDTIVGEVIQASFDNLEVYTTYYCYVKAFCDAEESDWSDVYSYTTRSTTFLPYEENFNMNYNQGYLSRKLTWVWNNSWPENQYNYCPHVNTNAQSVETRLRYSKDGTTCVVFSGSNSSDKVIPAEEWAYIASPEILEDDMKKVQISFWATAYEFVGSEYASSLLVGIMSDPADITTLEVIDTVRIKTINTFEQFIVPFDSHKYSGTGKFVALVSRFDKENMFFVDDVVIDYIPACKKVMGVKTKNTTPTSTELIWDEIPEALGYKVVITSAEVNDPSIPGSALLYEFQPISNMCSVPNLESFETYYVYVQAVCGADAGEWSNVYSFKTPCQAGQLPLYYTFETTEETYLIPGTSHSINKCLYPSTTNLNSMPRNYNDYAYEGRYALYIVGYASAESYVAFPSIDDLSNIRMSFYAQVNVKDWVGTRSVIEVGVMSDINDLSTFTSLDTIVTEYGYSYYVVDFNRYKGEGKNIAIIVSPENTGSCNVFVDNLTIKENDDCFYPIGISVIPDERSAQFSWYSSGENNGYRLVVSDTSIPETLLGKTLEEINNALGKEINLIDTLVDLTTCEVKGLRTNITTYYYYIQSICNGNESEWSVEATFKTLCATRNPLPFTEDFNTYSAGRNVTGNIPSCWQSTFRYVQEGSSSDPVVYYPHISTTGGYENSNYLQLKGSVPTSSNLAADYVVLPLMDVDSVKKLQVSFMLRLNYVTYSLDVGILSNPADTSSFITVETIKVSNEMTGIWHDVVVKLDSYQGTGEYIMFRAPMGASNIVGIDNVEVDYIQTCFKPTNLKARDLTEKSAVLYWDSQGEDETKWNLMVLNKSGVQPEDAPDSVIVFNQIISENPYLFDDESVEANTTYYYYLQAICGEDTLGWTIINGSFRTLCVPKTIQETGVETFTTGDTNFPCWEVGIQTNTGTGSPTLPRIYNNALYTINTTNTDGAYAIMPELNIDDIRDAQVTFTMYTETYSLTNQKSMIVGIITNANDFASFVPVDTVKLERVGDTNRKFTVRFDKYEGDYALEFGKRVMFMSSFGIETTNNVYIDDIYFDTIASCPETAKIWSDSVGTTAARLKWYGDEQTTYRIIVNEKTIDNIHNAILDTITVLKDTTVVGNMIELKNLQMLTDYYVYIQTVCSDTESGPWSNEYYFLTECPPTTPLPLVEDFESYGTGNNVKPSCWYTYYGSEELPGNTPNVSNYVNCFTPYNNTLNGTACLRLYSTSANYSLAVSPRLDVEDISDCQVSFSVLQAAAMTNNYELIVGLIDDPYNFGPGNYLPVDTICIARDQIDPQQYTWYTYKFDLSYLADHDSIDYYKHVLFFYSNSATTTLYLDDVDIEYIPDCERPDSLSYEKLTSSSFVATWTDTVGTSWNLLYVESGLSFEEGIPVQTSTPSILISGLRASTTYEVYVQTVCDDGTSRWSAPMAVTTICLVKPENALYSFEEEEGYYLTPNDPNGSATTIATYKRPNCWLLGSSNPYSDINVPYNYKSSTSSRYSRTGEFALRFYIQASNREAYAIMPEIDADLDTLQVRFSARAVYTNASGIINSSSYNFADDEDAHILVGTVEDPYDFGTFEELAKVDLSRWVTGDIATAENNFFWDDVVVPLYGVNGKYITLAASYKDACEDTYTYTYNVYVDDVSLEKVTACSFASRIKFQNYNTQVTSVDLRWNEVNDQHNGWNVKVLTEKIDIDTVANVPNDLFIFNDKVNTNFVPGLNIQHSTTYYVYIQAVCDELEASWIMMEIKTPCALIEDLPMEWTFEEGGGYKTGTSAFFAPDCWIVGLKNGSTQANIPYKYPDETAKIYSRTDGDKPGHSLRFYNTNSNSGAYAIMPGFVGDMDTLQVRFHVRAAAHSNVYTAGYGYKITSVETGSSRIRSITIGTVTDQDINTFVPIDTFQLSVRATSEYANEENNWLFDEVVIPLNGTPGNYVAFMCDFPGVYNYVFMDDVSIERLGGCYAPHSLKIDSITSSTAKISWTNNVGGDEGVRWVIQAATDAEMTNIVYQGIASVHGAHPITGLNPATTYYAAVKQICNTDDESEWSEPVEFISAFVPLFNETFSTGTHNPYGWTKYNGYFNKDIINTESDLTINTNTLSGNTWVRFTNGYGLPTAHQLGRINSSGTRYWMVSPIIELSQEKYQLSFDLALTAMNSDQPIPEDMGNVAYRFITVISEDGGFSWNVNNATIWDNQGTGDFVFNDIATYGEQINIDLSPYKGKLIKVGFYVERTASSGTSIDLHLDNVRINRYAELNIEEPLCFGNDYNDYGFDILYNELKAGVNNFTRTSLSNNRSVADSIVTLKLTVTDIVVHSVKDNICEGEIYEGFGFDPIGRDGIYKQKLTCSNGCDSVVVLNLSSTPAIRIDISETICQGQSYNFNGIDYNRGGFYADTLTSWVTKCDSIIRLQLTVTDYIRDTISETVCFGSTYMFGTRELSESGVYLDTVKTLFNCDSVVTLNLVVRDELITYIEGTTCPGVPFSGHGFSDVPPRTGTYPLPIKTTDLKCDSMVILRLTVLDGDTIWLEETITQKQLPYPYYGILYEEGTPVGTYSDTTLVSSGDGDCQSIRVATLNIVEDGGPGTGLWTPAADELSIIPTIIEKGQTVRIFYDMSMITGLKIEVYDMTGRCIHTQHPTVEPIEIDAFPNSGMYLIRATSSQGDIKHGRVIVK